MPDFSGLYGLPPGADFPREFVAGVLHLHRAEPPDALARVEVIVNSERMRRRMTDAFIAEGPILLPRLRLVADLTDDPMAPPTTPIPPLRRQLSLTQLIAAFLDRDPTMAPRTDAFALAESLVTLLSEMEDEGVAPEDLADLDLGELSAHWARSRAFLDIVKTYLDASGDVGRAAALRLAVEARIARWHDGPPDHPVIVAGSTGSRGTTRMLIEAVARLPNGAVVLPGFDFAQPGPVWTRLMRDGALQDHPQYRFAALLSDLDARPEEVRRWTGAEPDPARNMVVSLALRPAPVTDQWLSEGAALPDLRDAFARTALVEAADPRQEALAIALRLRAAVEDGRTAALITPDRSLARRVTVALDRWRLVPDDSAGRPLGLSAPGRLLRQIARAAGRPIDPAALLALLKHPLANSLADRGDHMRRTRLLELHLRRQGKPAVGTQLLAGWAERQDDTDARAWALWLIELFGSLADPGERALADHVARHLRAADRLAQGPEGQKGGKLWLEAAGEEARKAMEALNDEARAGGAMRPVEYAALIDHHFASYIVRDSRTTEARIKIWGTLEARVQGADLVIVAGLNEGVWPALPSPDPWLNRTMRRDVGLLSPERQVGLSAHDFQQAAAAPEVVFSRALRTDEAETVMSRWLNRLANLVSGLPDNHGPAAWTAMQDRGAQWTDLARAVDADMLDTDPAVRPAPSPPVDTRPKSLSVTEIQTLIRDPYAVYARRVLNLRPLDPLTPQPDALVRGTVFHKVVERLAAIGLNPDAVDAVARFQELVAEILDAEVPWPEMRVVWSQQLGRIAPFVMQTEAALRRGGVSLGQEVKGSLALGTPDFTLVGKIDRIDRQDDGRLSIYDYKTGALPTKKQIALFDRQLMLEAAMVEMGDIEGMPRCEVAEVGHIGLGSKPELRRYPLRQDGDDRFDPADELAKLRQLIAAYFTPDRGYAARRAMESLRYDGPYDHLARYGEWDASQTAQRISVP